MARREMWMGPRGGETWVPQEAISGDRQRGAWSSTQRYLNGQAGIRHSVASHMTYSMTWNLNTRDALRAISDMRAGIRGPGLIYFIDPMAADKNVLNEAWSFPAQATYDAIPLTGDTRPERVYTPANSLGYPPESARYKLPAGLTSETFYLPIPPGFVAWVGVHGSIDGTGGVCVTPVVNNSLNDADTYPAMLSVTDVTRVNTAYSSYDYQGLELSLKAGTATAVVLSGLMVQILPEGRTPATGGFISGQGHSGCRFVETPSISPYSVGTPGVEMGMSAKLEEVIE